MPPLPSTSERTSLEGREGSLRGMSLSMRAREHPDAPAVLSPHGDRSFDQLNARANQLARALRARGLTEGDGLVLVCSNRPEFAEVFAAAMRSGLRLTTINWHLTADEIAYIADDCEARALVGDARFAEALARAAARAPKAGVRLAVGGAIPSFEPYEEALAPESTADLDDPSLGNTMLYTSGTTGRPKGVERRPLLRRKRDAQRRLAKLLAHRAGEDVSLCTGPLYHAAPLAFSLSGPLHAGAAVVLMDGWSAEGTLERIERHRVTHVHMVPTMFHRLLSLPEATRARFDLRSLRFVLHGAAPCPVAVKRALIEWLGPIVYEYYAATEGWGSLVTPEAWLERPGTVGRPEPGHVRILSEAGEELAAGEIGRVFLRAPEDDHFRYFKAEDKTRSAYDDGGDHFTLGDMGYLDADGYLFLADRTADVIISGGVNVYPAEVDAVLLGHPGVADVATVGIPNDEWGEEVRSVVELRPGVEPNPELAAELVDFCRGRLAHFKCPRCVDFVDALPRHETGKIYRRLVRDPYWAGRDGAI